MARSKIFVLTCVFAYMLAGQSPVRAQEAQAVKTKTPEIAEPPRVLGIWRSPSPEKVGKSLFMTREIQFTLSRWEETRNFASDEAMKKSVLIFHGEGPFDLKKVDQSWALDLHATRRALNLQQSSPVLRELGASGCTLTKKKEVEISTSGCGHFPAIKACPTEFEVVELKDGKLSLGEQPGDTFNCDEKNRPQKFGVALKKVN